MLSFGFNTFQQTNPKETASIAAPNYSSSIKRVLLATWETTFLWTEEDKLVVWGFQPNISLPEWEEKHPLLMFGDVNSILGLIDAKRSVYFCSTQHPEKPLTCIATCAKDAVYCSGLDAIYVLTVSVSGKVECYTQLQGPLKMSLLNIPVHVHSMAASPTHMLFYTSGLDPVYALGSNRFSQLGSNFQHAMEIVEPCTIEFFCGLGMYNDTAQGSVTCGLFHSAVIIEGDVYTFGLKKQGQLGWGEDQNADQDTLVKLCVFVDATDAPVEVDALEVACGATHTVVLDGN
ncbi:regulator of chromosome condensation 1/beta-lactamase-inhibitor protein II [Spinellus fusiger]|nr:regulator of chromosome condensation 1/beta-lactamase-inhibitor protein II [Spinellus fusiger]